jgi:hypothetical protein
MQPEEKKCSHCGRSNLVTDFKWYCVFCTRCDSLKHKIRYWERKADNHPGPLDRLDAKEKAHRLREELRSYRNNPHDWKDMEGGDPIELPDLSHGIVLTGPPIEDQEDVPTAREHEMVDPTLFGLPSQGEPTS